MKKTLSFRGPEPLNAVLEHPVGGTIGGVLTAIVCGGIGGMAAGPGVGLLMGALGLFIGAAGGAHIAESAQSNQSV
jgi:hypothetical protein